MTQSNMTENKLPAPNTIPEQILPKNVVEGFQALTTSLGHELNKALFNEDKIVQVEDTPKGERIKITQEGRELAETWCLKLLDEFRGNYRQVIEEVNNYRHALSTLRKHIKPDEPLEVAPGLVVNSALEATAMERLCQSVIGKCRYDAAQNLYTDAEVERLAKQLTKHAPIPVSTQELQQYKAQARASGAEWTNPSASKLAHFIKEARQRKKGESFFGLADEEWAQAAESAVETVVTEETAKNVQQIEQIVQAAAPEPTKQGWARRACSTVAKKASWLWKTKPGRVVLAGGLSAATATCALVGGAAYLEGRIDHALAASVVSTAPAIGGIITPPAETGGGEEVPPAPQAPVAPATTPAPPQLSAQPPKAEEASSTPTPEAPAPPKPEKKVESTIFYELAKKFIDLLNRGKEMPPGRENTALIVFAVQGSERNQANGRVLFETDGNFLVYLTAKDGQVFVDIVSPFTRDFVPAIDHDSPQPRHKIKHLASYRGLDYYIRTMEQVGGQPAGGFLMVDMQNVAKTVDFLFPEGMPMDVPVEVTTIGGVHIPAGMQKLNGAQLIAYAAERKCFGETCPAYPGPDGQPLVGDSARAQKGVDIFLSLLKATAKNPAVLQRLPDMLNLGALQMSEPTAKALQDIDLLKSGAQLAAFFLANKAGLETSGLPFHIRTISPGQTGVALCTVTQERVDKGEYLAYSQIPCDPNQAGAQDTPSIYYGGYIQTFNDLIGSHK